jgi:hypothetical protein
MYFKNKIVLDLDVNLAQSSKVTNYCISTH